MLIRASFRPNADVVTLLSRLVGDVCRLELADADISDRFRMAAHELGENITKYSTASEVSLELELAEKEGFYVLSVRTKNRTSPERLADVSRRLREIIAAPDPGALYDRLLERSVELDGVSGLGLARIRAEGGVTLVYSIDGDELTVTVAAPVPPPIHQGTWPGQASKPESSAASGEPRASAPPSSPSSGLPESQEGDDVVPVVPIEDSIDLHGFQPRDIPSVVEEYVRAAAELGFHEVRLIHGRGIGFQRQRVREVLSRCAEVERFSDAPATRGGWGATLAWLRPAHPLPR